MTFNSHLTEFAGLPVFEYRPTRRADDPLATLAALRDPGAFAWLLRDSRGTETEEASGGVEGYFGRFAAETAAGTVTALVVGYLPETISTGHSQPVRDALVACAPRLTGLRSLFFADLTYEDCEVSWMNHGDLGPLLAAFPGLERFAVRGTGGLGLSVDGHPALRSLTLQGGGLPADLARQVLAGDYPALEHLELWLGVENYGGDTSPDHLAPLLNGEVHTGVRSLGLRNAQYTDRWVRALADAPVLGRLEDLDLSMGTLTDQGAQVLLDTPGFRELRRLDLHHHYMSEDMEKRVLEAFTAAGVAIDVSQREEPDDDDEEWEDDEDGWTYRYYPSVTE
ncbi:STM4015 family protein [Nocardiopsis sp. N85]|uniref:STM4015 family protein n=1 Tax=Nocardiopsis sp. N85 TaxID=3029400 RepID=UPI00237F4A0D|nr:STM4015 family protein [Nocardiopsis sp. N85]MDE3720680.1 STM4015 family protein [Nocardiopsis sp. N85]